MQPGQSNISRELKILIAGSLPETDIKSACLEVIDRLRFFEAGDGATATSKVLNDPPDLLVLTEPLLKKSAVEVTDWLLTQPRFKNIGILLLMPLPEEDLFVDEVLTGRVQIIETPCEKERFEHTLRRLLNYIEHRNQKEFYLKYLSKDELLFNEGEAPRFVYILRKGALVAEINRHGQKTVIGQIHPGEFVGEMAYINGRVRSATVRATSSCELIEIPVEIVDRVLFAKPSWAKALVKTLSLRLEKANQR